MDLEDRAKSVIPCFVFFVTKEFSCEQLFSVITFTRQVFLLVWSNTDFISKATGYEKRSYCVTTILLVNGYAGNGCWNQIASKRFDGIFSNSFCCIFYYSICNGCLVATVIYNCKTLEFLPQEIEKEKERISLAHILLMRADFLLAFSMRICRFQF